MLLRNFRHRAARKRPIVRLNVEALEARELLDGAPMPFGSADAFKQWLISSALTRYQDLFGHHFPSYGIPGPVRYLDNTVPAAFTSAQAAAPAGGLGGVTTTFSQTNVQIQGVDEGDIVKNDGTFIYDLNQQQGQLDIFQAVPADGMQVVSRTPIEGTPLAEYLDGNRVVIISTIYTYGGGTLDPVVRTPDGFPLIYPNSSKIKYTVLDVTDRTAPVTVTATYFDGYYISSREVGDQIYLVTQSYFAGLPAPEYTAFNGEAIYQSQADYLNLIDGHEFDLSLPHYYVHSGDSSSPLVPAGFVSDPAQIYQPQSPNDYNLLSVLAFDVTSNSSGPANSVSIFAPYASTVFASTSNLYVVLPRWSFLGASGASSFNGSQILQFGLDGPQVSLKATGFVEGQVLNQFSMDEQGPYFRIATTNWGEAVSTNNVIVMTDNGSTLEEVGSLTGIAPGTQLRSARFVGDLVYLDTYMYVDPLFAVSLSNPTAPQLLGELKIPGYVSYLQPLDATHLLGVGRSFGIGGGLTLSIFNTSDPSSLGVVDQTVINPSGWNWWWGSGSEAEWDHHALSYFSESGILAIPIYGSYVGFNYNALQSSLWVYQVDTTSGFHLLGQVNHDSQVRRSLRIGDELYSVADDSIQAHPLADPTAAGFEVRINDMPRFPQDNVIVTSMDAAYSGSVMTFHVTDASNLQATINWGDGQTSAGTLAAMGDGMFTVSGVHDFGQAGTFTPTVSFTRDGTSLNTLSSQVQVTDVDPRTLSYVRELYRDLLRREADTGGLVAFGEAIAHGQATRTQAALMIANSLEYRTLAIDDLYVHLLGRHADAGGSQAFVIFMSQGGTLEQTEQAILSSDEYFQRAGGTNLGFLSALYHDVLGRGLDTGLSLPPGLLSLFSRSMLAGAVVNSLEATTDRVQGFYQEALNRPADPAGLAAFVGMAQNGLRDDQALAILLGSDENFNSLGGV